MKIIDYPVKFSISDYQLAIDKKVKQFSDLNQVKSVYQIGSISTPGVSDIDMLIVFDDDIRYAENPRATNTTDENYLFTHTLYGCSQKQFVRSFDYTFFHNHKLLYGHEYNIENRLSASDQSLLKKQIALEFLAKMYINLMVQKSYNTIKLRSLFLHIKALVYDFEFLGINPQELIEIINQGLYFRNNWFNEAFSDTQIMEWFKRFYTTFESFLSDLLKTEELFVQQPTFKTAPNISIIGANQLQYKRKGIVVPDVFNFFGKKYFKALNKMNSFEVHMNLNTDAPQIVQEYLSYVEGVRLYNQTNLPYFMSLTSSLNVYKS